MTYLNGIDISSIRSGLNIKDIDANFVIIKATTGTKEKDVCFNTWAENIIDSNKKLGIYHYAIGNESAEKESSFFWENVKQYSGKSIFVLNWTGKVVNCGPNYAKDFLDNFYKISGIHCLICMDKNTVKEYKWDEVEKNYKLWIIDCSNNNPVKYHYVEQGEGCSPWSNPVICRYSQMGVVDGYPANLNINCFYGTEEKWNALLEGKQLQNKEEKVFEKDGFEKTNVPKEENNIKTQTAKGKKTNQYKKTSKK